ncbi:hypothetical protein [Lacticaseibacillus sharpeae]|uniref:hypothetical protein n=1 Tax=Lacticaseibacillus sharpeae TaxID=1626 RepID=UPI0012E0D987|nr:hypothetical protein [Lacticaseibacillus sharpeae]
MTVQEECQSTAVSQGFTQVNFILWIVYPQICVFVAMLRITRVQLVVVKNAILVIHTHYRPVPGLNFGELGVVDKMAGPPEFGRGFPKKSGAKKFYAPKFCAKNAIIPSSSRGGG